MMAYYCCKAWTLLSRARILAARRSFYLLSEWGRAPVRHLAKDGQSWFPCRAFAKITFVCWGIGGLSQGVRCNGAAYRDAHIIGDALFPKGSLFSVAFLRWTWLAFSVVIRACVLLLKFGPLVLLYPFTYLSPSFMSLWIHLLLKVTESSGPTYIKLGQWASTRRDLFSEEFCVKFSKLHIKVIPHPWAYTEYSLGKAFGVGWERVFRFESQEPVGSGCIAQVYKAYMDLSAVGEPVLKELSKNSVLDSTLETWEVSSLKGLLRWLWKRKHKGVLEGYGGNQLHHEDGFREGASQNSVSGNPSKLLSSAKRDCLIPVAIKVLHPGLVHQVQMDLFLMKTGSRFLELLPGIKWLSLTEIVEEFEKLMIQQIDLHYEARNLENFRLNFRDVDYVKFPIPLHPFVTRNILVETFEESKPISHYLHTEATMELRQKIAKMGMDMLLKMVFVDNFVHADLHPGNILVQGGKCSVDCLEDRAASADLLDMLVLEVQPPCSPLRLVVLDAGIIAALQGTDFANLRAVFTAVVLGQILFGTFTVAHVKLLCASSVVNFPDFLKPVERTKSRSWASALFSTGERVAELILHHSRANRCKDVERFKADMAELVTKARHNTIALGKLQVASLLSSVFKLLMTHQVKLESNFASVIFAIMVLEGLGRSLDPELDILKAAKPFLLKPSSSLLE